MTNTRFDLEQEILDCWGICDDIKTLETAILEGNMPLTVDNVANILTGLRCLYQLKFDKTFNTFERLLDETKR